MAIAIEAPDTVHAGDAITGKVRATGRVRVFVVRTVTWRSRSGVRDIPIRKTHESVVVTGDAPFTLPALRGPLTHRGENVELAWSVAATPLDESEPAVEIPFVLVAPRATTYEREAVGGYRDRATETTTLEPDLGDLHVEGPRRLVPVDPLSWVSGWVLRTFAALAAARGGASNVTLDVAPSRVRAGDELTARLAFTTAEEIVVESITIQLAAREYFAVGRENEPLIESRIETVTSRAKVAPGPHVYETRLRVPEGAPASFATSGVGLEWFVRATIQIDGQVDAVSDFVIGVAPF